MADHPVPLTPPHVAAESADFPNPHQLLLYRGPMTGEWLDDQSTTDGNPSGGSSEPINTAPSQLCVNGAGAVTLRLFPDPHIEWDFRHDGITKELKCVPPQSWPLILPPSALTVQFASRAGHHDLPDIPVACGHYIGISRLSDPIDIGPKSSPLDEVRFYLVNFQVGLLPHDLSRVRKAVPNSAVRLRSGPWRLDIEQLPGSYRAQVHIEELQAFAITHLCRLWRQTEDGTADDFTFEDAEPVLEANTLFVSFVRSAMVGLALPVAYKNGKSVFERWQVTTADPGRYAHPHQRWSWPGWFPHFHPLGRLNPRPQAHLPSLFESFAGRFLHGDNDTRRFWQSVLGELVCTYTDAERMDKTRAIVPACTALETLTWAILVVQEQWLTGDGYPSRGRAGYEKLTAADRLRLLLRWAGVPADVPLHLPALSTRSAQHNGTMDLADLIAWTRNRVVHPDKHDQLASDLSVEAWAAAMWCTELITLKLLGYDGYYRNRLNELAVERVPWSAA